MGVIGDILDSVEKVFGNKVLQNAQFQVAPKLMTTSKGNINFP